MRGRDSRPAALPAHPAGRWPPCGSFRSVWLGISVTSTGGSGPTRGEKQANGGSAASARNSASSCPSAPPASKRSPSPARPRDAGPRATCSTSSARTACAARGATPGSGPTKPPSACKPVQIVQRTAGNLYYPVVHSALDIPESDEPATRGDEELAGRVREHDLWVSLCRVAGTPRADVFRAMIQEDTGADDQLLDALLAEEPGQPLPAASSDTAAAPGRPDLSREEWAAFTAPIPTASRDFALRETTLGLGQRDGRTLGRSTPPHRPGRPRRPPARGTRTVRLQPGLPGRLARPRRHRRRLVASGRRSLRRGHPPHPRQGRTRRMGKAPACAARVAGIRADFDRSFQKDRLQALTGEEPLPALRPPAHPRPPADPPALLRIRLHDGQPARTRLRTPRTGPVRNPDLHRRGRRRRHPRWARATGRAPAPRRDPAADDRGRRLVLRRPPLRRAHRPGFRQPQPRGLPRLRPAARDELRDR